MSNLLITSVTLDEVSLDGPPAIEVSGEWIGDTQPPRILRNFYRDEDDSVLQDIYHRTQFTVHTDLIDYYSLGNRTMNLYQGSRRTVVSYKLMATEPVKSTDIVSDYVFGSNPDEYTVWNLIARRNRNL